MDDETPVAAPLGDQGVAGPAEAGTARTLSLLVLQSEPMALDNPRFEAGLARRLQMLPQTNLVVLPELHLHPGRRDVEISSLAHHLPGPLTERLGTLARQFGVWLLPGSVYEAGEAGSVYNTAIAISPTGELVATYRKCFPWRPHEETSPGTRFVVFDIPGIGRIGLSICYDTWFPELARHLAWMGADVIIQETCTFTSDRPQELVLARATAITNQVFVVNVNAAAPFATGRSMIIDPEGRVRAEAGESPVALTDTIDLAEVARVRHTGTSGVDRVWDQFRPDDAELPLPLYGGRIDPMRWRPASTLRPESLRDEHEPISQFSNEDVLDSRPVGAS